MIGVQLVASGAPEAAVEIHGSVLWTGVSAGYAVRHLLTLFGYFAMLLVQ